MSLRHDISTERLYCCQGLLAIFIQNFFAYRIYVRESIMILFAELAFVR
jgi:hypothetical protein